MKRLSAAESLLQELGVTEPEEIDLEAIAWYVGATIRRTPLTSCEARIIGFQDRAIISVDPSRSKRRQRFSVAHELGHWHHHRGRSFVCRSDDIGSPNRTALDPERVADSYAADLLMPEYLFRPWARRDKRLTIEAISALSDAFATSLTATALRAIDLGPSPAMLICHTQRGRKWFKAGPDVPRRWFPRTDLDAESIAFEVLYGKLEQSPPRLVGADAWFDRAEASRYELHEQAVRIGDGEILALLEFREARMLED